MEWLHAQAVAVDDIPLADLNHVAAVGHDPPRCIQELANEGIDAAVYTTTARLPDYLVCELRIAGREHPASGDIVVVFKEFALFFCADCDVDLASLNVSHIHHCRSSEGDIGMPQRASAFLY